MTALTPALAVDYVRELSADVRAVVVLDAHGGLLAGPPELEARARALLEAGGGAGELEAGGPAGVVCAVRSESHAAVAICGRFAIGGVVRNDLRTALAALAGRSPAAADVPFAGRSTDAQGRSPAAAGARAGPTDPALMRAAEALISAVQREFGG
jgi:hypothetical protein